MISSSRTTFVANDRAAAIAAAREGQGTHATDVGRVFEGWPQLLPYVNDNGPERFTREAPEYIWDSVTAASQTRFFAAAVPQTVSLSKGHQFLVNLTVFCDNAHDARIDIFDVKKRRLFTTITPENNLIDGSLDPNAPDVPFNWLNIRYYSNTSVPVDSKHDDHRFQIVVSFEAVNYCCPPSNPAGLAFVADIWAG